MVQTVIDNFDLGKTNDLAMILTQHGSKEHQMPKTLIPRIPKRQLKECKLSEPKYLIYSGDEKPAMPALPVEPIIPDLRVLAFRAQQKASFCKAKSLDFKFLADITHLRSTPEFNGFNKKWKEKC